MTARLQILWQVLIGSDRQSSQAAPAPISPRGRQAPVQAFEIAPNDPLLAYLQGAGSAVKIDSLSLDSPAVRALKEADVKIAVPLISPGGAGGPAEPGAPPQRAGVLHRRPQAPTGPGGSGVPGGAGRTTGAPAAGGGSGPPSVSTRSCASPGLSNRLSCPKGSHPCPAGSWQPIISRPARLAATSTTSWSCLRDAWALS